MIRTAPVSDVTLRDRAVIRGSITAIIFPFLIGSLFLLFGTLSSSSRANAIAMFLLCSPLLSIPLVLIGSVGAKYALLRGIAGPFTAVAVGGSLGAVFGFLLGWLNNAGMFSGFTVFFGSTGLLWALFYWMGVLIFASEAVRGRARQ
ncbi:hypothetical protein AB3Y40_03900 [Yoonia sp. R2331]|uniref:hypothetical protein n=1 Tax=Yoonia sp. R2331 TaxID=3237238 RepID=UPI0034E61C64